MARVNNRGEQREMGYCKRNEKGEGRAMAIGNGGREHRLLVGVWPRSRGIEGVKKS